MQSSNMLHLLKLSYAEHNEAHMTVFRYGLHKPSDMVSCVQHVKSKGEILPYGLHFFFTAASVAVSASLA